MFCNSRCGFFGIGVGRFPRNLPFLNGDDCCDRRDDDCGCCR